jgi:hypothetical protein
MKKKIIAAVILAGVTIYACEKESLFSSDNLPATSSERAIGSGANDQNALQLLRPHTITKDGNVSTFAYDKSAALIAIESPIRKDLFTRDGYGRVTELTTVILNPVADRGPGLMEKRTRYVYRYVGEEKNPRSAKVYETPAGSNEAAVANVRFTFTAKGVKTGEWIEDLRNGEQTSYEYSYDNYNRLVTVTGMRNGARVYFKRVTEFGNGHSATAKLDALALEPGIGHQRGNPVVTLTETPTEKLTLKCEYTLNDYHQPVRILERDNLGHYSETTIAY